jgi:Uma2 family endonuclease
MSYQYSATRRIPSRKDRPGQPAWDLALMLPPQGLWTEEAFLELEANSENHMIELVDGHIEVLPMPDTYHQRIVGFLYRKLHAFVEKRGSGEVLLAPLPVRLWKLQLREPDIVYLEPGRVKDPHKPPEGADLVMEIVSPGKESRKRDLRTKRRVYAKAKIGEYWIIDPAKKTITVLVLDAGRYMVHGRHKPGEKASSKLLRGFKVDVAGVFAAGEMEG